jgi:CxxC motif-containing protein
VKTARPIPKTKSLPGAIALAGLKVKPPVKAGDVVISNLAGTGVDVVATGNLLS